MFYESPWLGPEAQRTDRGLCNLTIVYTSVCGGLALSSPFCFPQAVGPPRATEVRVRVAGQVARCILWG